MKRFFTFVASLAMCAATFAAATVEKNGITYEVQSDLTVKVIDNGDQYASLTTVSIPSKILITGKMLEESTTYYVSGIAANAFKENATITSVTITFDPTLVSSYTIGAHAFYNMTALESVEWKATSEDACTVTVGNGVFSGCSNLQTATLPNQLTTLDQFTFYQCKALTSVTLPSSLKTISQSAFMGCSSLTQISLPNGLQEIGTTAFRSCNIKEYISLPASLTTLGAYAFSRNVNLVYLVIPENVTSIGKGFVNGCTKFDNFQWNPVSFPDFATPEDAPFYDVREQISEVDFDVTVKHIPAYLCYGMKNMEQTDWAGAQVETVGDFAFYGCEKWGGAVGVLKNSFNTKLQSIGNAAFAYIPMVWDEDVYFPNTLTTIGDSAFAYTGLTSITIPEDVTKVGADIVKGCDKLEYVDWMATEVASPDSPEKSPFYSVVSHILDFDFDGADQILPAYLFYGVAADRISVHDVKEIGDYAFANSKKAEKIYLSDSSLKKIGKYAFDGTSATVVYLFEPWGINPPEVDLTSFGENETTEKKMQFIVESGNCGNAMSNYEAHEIWSQFNLQVLGEVYFDWATSCVARSYEGFPEGSPTNYPILLKQAQCEDLSFTLLWPDEYIPEGYQFDYFEFNGERSTDNPATFPISQKTGNTLTIAVKKNKPTAIEAVEASSPATAQKMIIDGQLYILRAGKTYNALGAEVR